MNRMTIILWLALFLPAPAWAQEKLKFPIGVSSKVLGYGHLWAAWRRGYFEGEGLAAEVVLMRGTAPAVQALISQSILAGLVANDGPIAAVEQGMDLAMVASGSTSRRIPWLRKARQKTSSSRSRPKLSSPM